MDENTIVLIGLLTYYPVVITAALLVVHSMRSRDKEAQRIWQDAAEKHGLQVVETGRPFLVRTGPLEVRLDLWGDTKTELAIKIPGPPDLHQVRIRRQVAKPDPGVRQG